MRRIKQKKLMELIDVVRRGLDEVICHGGMPETMQTVIHEYLNAFEIIEKSVMTDFSEKKQKEYQNISRGIRNGFNKITSLISHDKLDEDSDINVHNLEIDKALAEIRSDLGKMQHKLAGEEEIQYLLLFLPYKASMWDSMESVWLAACRDPRCTVFVAPIPYFDRKPDGTFGDMHYEGGRMPDYVDIVDCMQLDLEQLMPEVIYFHNPYDEHNYVTSVHPAFYSRELKKYTDLLVYLFYFVPGAYESAESAAVSFQTTGMWNADLIIAQSEVHKALMEANGNAAEKIAVLGSPKLDYVLNHLGECQVLGNWKNKLKDRKVFLVCSSVGTFLGDKNTIEQYDALLGWLIYICHAAVIYRPHPLLESTIKTMRPWQYDRYMEFVEKYLQCEYFILDHMEDPMPSICASSCMISDYSSMCFTYAVTGKPVAVSSHNGVPPTDECYYAFDYRGVDFIALTGWTADGEAPESLKGFVQGVMDGEDSGKGRRMELLMKSVVNLDGTSGEKIHKYALGRLEGSLS